MQWDEVTVRSLRVVFLLVTVAVPVSAQQDVDVARAQQAYDELDFRAVIPAAQRALQKPGLSMQDRIIAYELLGFTYGALDSTVQAVEAFRNLIFLDPDREPDAVRVTPRITSLYANALSQVLVVRKIEMDSTSFIGGQDVFDVRFELSRPGQASLRVVGGGMNEVVDVVPSVAGQGGLSWNLQAETGALAEPGDYQLVIEARFGDDEFAVPRNIRLTHAPVDTLPHLLTHPDRDSLPETEQPGRNWKPLGLAVLYTTLASGASLALENTTLGRPARREIGGVALVALVTGFVMSLRKPDPIPVPGNILYNQLLREDLARLNGERATQNEVRRNQTRVTVIPVLDGN